MRLMAVSIVYFRSNDLQFVIMLQWFISGALLVVSVVDLRSNVL